MNSGLYKESLYLVGLLETPHCETVMSQTQVLVIEISLMDESSVWEARRREGLVGAETCLSLRRVFQLATLDSLIATIRCLRD